MINIKRITAQDDLKALAESIVGDEWGLDNELHNYSAKALIESTNRPDYALLVAYDGTRPVGLALAMKLVEPDGRDWLYIDQLDVHPDSRRKGVGRQLMDTLFDIGREWNLTEAWLGTEPDNNAANGLYESLHPDETEPFIGYTYKIEKKEK